MLVDEIRPSRRGSYQPPHPKESIGDVAEVSERRNRFAEYSGPRGSMILITERTREAADHSADLVHRC